MPRLFLVRHAHTVWSPDDMRPLSDRGCRDAQRMADVLAPHPITRVFSSPYTRAVQTVEPLAERLGVPVEIDDGLRERRLSLGKVADFEAAVEATWRDFDWHPPGGESNRTAQARVAAAMERILAACGEEHVAISTHGNVLALYLNHLDPSTDFAFWKNLTLPDAYRLQRQPGACRWSLERIWAP